MRSQRASSQAALRDESAGLLSRDLEKLSRLGCLPIVTKRTEVEELKANRNENENEEERRGEEKLEANVSVNVWSEPQH